MKKKVKARKSRSEHSGEKITEFVEAVNAAVKKKPPSGTCK